MIRLIPLCSILLLSACVVSSLGSTIQQGMVGVGLAEPEGPPPPPPNPPLPLEVINALPPGAPTSTVILDNEGCYIFTVEATDPPSGYPMRDASGTRLCAANTGEPIYTNAPQTAGAPAAAPPAPAPVTTGPAANAPAQGGFVPPFAGATGGVATAAPISGT